MNRSYSHGQTYDRLPIITIQQNKERINYAVALLICFAIGCALALTAY